MNAPASQSPAPTRVVPSDRVPPHSEEAERGVLGSILLDASKVMDICLSQQLTAESFYIPAHRIIFEIMTDMAVEGRPIDVLTLSERLAAAGKVEQTGGPLYLNQLIDSTPTAAHAEYYIDLVRQKHLLRCIIASSRESENDCYVSTEGADLVLARAEQNIMMIGEQQHGFVTPWHEAVKQAVKHIETVLETKTGLSGISSGFANLDAILLGLRAGEMIVLAARPGMGKTALALNIAEKVALGKTADGAPKPVGMFSLEMSHESLVMRILCSHSQVPSFKVAGGRISMSDHAKLMQAAATLTKAPILLDDTGGLDIMELRARARRMKKKQGVELIIVDYLQLLHSKEHSKQGRQVETAEISGHLKTMAKELKAPVLVISQLSRAPETRSNLAVPKLSDLRDSGAIEQDADVVCMLRRPCKYPEDPDRDDRTLAIMEVVKQRNGPTGVARFNFIEEYTRFEDRAHGVDGAEPVSLEENLDVQ